MGGEHGLGPPQVRVGGDHEILLPLRHPQERPLELGQARVEPVDRPPAVEPEVGGHLIVAAPGRVELAAGVAEPRRERRLDVEVDVFLGDGELEPPGPDLAADLLEGLGDRVGLLHRDQPDRGQHPGVGDRTVDVIVGQPLVERDALREGLDAGVGRLTKHASPGFLRTA